MSGPGAGVARVLVAGCLAFQAVGALCLAGAERAAVLALHGEGCAAVGRPQGEHGRRDDGGDDGGGDGTRAQPVPAGGAVLGVHGEAAPVEARAGDPRPRDVRHRHVERGAGGLQDGECGGRDAGAGPAAGDRALRGAAAAGAVVDVPDQFAAQGGAEHEPVVAGEAGHAGTGAGLHDGQGGAGAFDLAGGGGEEFPGGGQVHAEDRGDLVRGEPVADGEFQRLTLLGRGAGGLRPGELGEFAAVPSAAAMAVVSGPARPSSVAVAVGGAGRGARARGRGVPWGRPWRAPLDVPAAPDVSAWPRPACGGRPSGPGRTATPCGRGRHRAALAAALGERQDVAQGGGRGVVVAEHGQAVGEQAVQIRLVARAGGRCARVRAAARSRASRCARCAPVVRVEVSGLLLITRRP